MKIKVLAGEISSEEILRQEFKEAKKVAEVRLGENYLFYRYFIRIKAIEYNAIIKAHLRIESGEVGEFPLTEHYLILRDTQRNDYELRLEHPEDAKAVLSFLETHYPAIEIGHYKKKTDKV